MKLSLVPRSKQPQCLQYPWDTASDLRWGCLGLGTRLHETAKRVWLLYSSLSCLVWPNPILHWGKLRVWDMPIEQFVTLHCTAEECVPITMQYSVPSTWSMQLAGKLKLEWWLESKLEAWEVSWPRSILTRELEHSRNWNLNAASSQVLLWKLLSLVTWLDNLNSWVTSHSMAMSQTLSLGAERDLALQDYSLPYTRTSLFFFSPTFHEWRPTTAPTVLWPTWYWEDEHHIGMCQDTLLSKRVQFNGARGVCLSRPWSWPTCLVGVATYVVGTRNWTSFTL